MKRFTIILLLLYGILWGNTLAVKGNIAAAVELTEAGNLGNLLADKAIDGESLLLCGRDGTCAYVNWEAAKAIELVLSDSVWSARSDSLPPVVNINDLSEIAVWKGGWKEKIYLQLAGGFPQPYTPFQFLLAGYKKTAESEKNGFAAVKYLPAESSIWAGVAERVIIEYKDGSREETVFEENDFEFDGCRFWYKNKEMKKIVGL